jgi:hypothetical protein
MVMMARKIHCRKIFGLKVSSSSGNPDPEFLD